MPTVRQITCFVARVEVLKPDRHLDSGTTIHLCNGSSFFREIGDQFSKKKKRRVVKEAHAAHLSKREVPGLPGRC